MYIPTLHGHWNICNSSWPNNSPKGGLQTSKPQQPMLGRPPHTEIQGIFWVVPYIWGFIMENPFKVIDIVKPPWKINQIPDWWVMNHMLSGMQIHVMMQIIYMLDYKLLMSPDWSDSEPAALSRGGQFVVPKSWLVGAFTPFQRCQKPSKSLSQTLDWSRV